jgi:hypothetical protein
MEPNFDSVIKALLLSVFIGFGIVVPILSGARSSNLKTIEFKNLFILTAVQLVRISGILYFVLWLLDLYKNYAQYDTNKPGVDYTLFGPLWLVFWMPPILYFLLSQVFWFKKIYTRKSAFITFSILLFILPFQKLWIIISGLFNEYHRVTEASPAFTVIAGVALNVIIFTFLVITLILMSGKLKDKNSIKNNKRR